LVGKRLAARLAGMGTGLNVPIVHELQEDYRARSETRNPKGAREWRWVSRLQAVHRQNSDLPPEGGTPNTPNAKAPVDGIPPKKSRGKLQIPAICPDGATGFV
jgi:hypothetical protein